MASEALIVGGAGFIGSNLAHRWTRADRKVTVVDNLFTGRADHLPPGVELHRMSASEPAFLETCAGRPWDAVVHLGGASSAPMFDQDPFRLTEAVACMQNTMEVATQADAPVAFASTSSIYAGCAKPYNEGLSVFPRTMYEASKLAMEDVAQAYAESRGLNIAALRFFSVYGPREQGKGRYANIVSQFLWCLQAGIPPLVYGDGSQTRDFTHVDDLLLALDTALGAEPGFQQYNVGTGVEHTFNDVLGMLQEELGSAVDPVYVANPIRNYVQETQADTSRLEGLGWRARTALRDGVRALVEDSQGPDEELVARMREAHAVPEGVATAV